MNFGEVAAFQSQTHWEIAKETLVVSSQKLNTQEKKIYQSGAFLADIGRLSWDSKNTDSDSEIFAETLSKNCDSKNPAENLFSLGWKHHVVQDSLGSVVGSIFKSGNYTIGCSRLENYFKNNGNKMLFSGEQSFYINCDLIRKTYESLHGFPPSDEDMFLELNKLIIGVNLISSLPQSKLKLSETEEQGLKSQIDKLSQICAKDFEGISCLTDVKDEHTSFETTNPVKVTISETDPLSQKLKEFSKVAYIEKVGKYKNFDEVIYKIDDQSKYESLIKETIPLAMSLIK